MVSSRMWGRSKSVSSSTRLAGLDLGEIEDVVDEAEEGLAAGADDLGVFALFGIEAGILREARPCR